MNVKTSKQDMDMFILTTYQQSITMMSKSTLEGMEHSNAEILHYS